MNKQELKKAATRVVWISIQENNSDIRSIAMRYLNEVVGAANWTLGELFVLETMATKLANDSQFIDRIKAATKSIRIY